MLQISYKRAIADGNALIDIDAAMNGAPPTTSSSSNIGSVFFIGRKTLSEQ